MCQRSRSKSKVRRLPRPTQVQIESRTELGTSWPFASCPVSLDPGFALPCPVHLLVVAAPCPHLPFPFFLRDSVVVVCQSCWDWRLCSRSYFGPYHVDCLVPSWAVLACREPGQAAACGVPYGETRDLASQGDHWLETENSGHWVACH